MKTKRITFKNQNNQELAASLESPLIGKPKAYAIFAHCFTCSKDLSAVVNISRALTQNGLAVLRFDFTGLGSSEGEFAETNFSSNVEDLVSAYKYLSEDYSSPQLLIGHSLGGAAVLAAAHKMESIGAVVTVGAPHTPSHVKHLFDDSIDKIKEQGSAKVNIGGRPFQIKSQLIEDLEESDSKSRISELRKALLILHSPQDKIVGINNAKSIYEQAHHPKSFVTLDGADHLLSKKEDSFYTASVIATWAMRYIKTTTTPKLEAKKQVSTRTTEESYVTEISTEKHSLIADEPESVGGTDLGPTPYDLLVAALGACTSMTLRMYAQRKEWDLKEAIIHLEHYKYHVEDGGHVDENDAKLDHIDREIELIGDLSDEQKQRLMEIADKCPVHKTLHSKIVVNTKAFNSEPE